MKLYPDWRLNLFVFISLTFMVGSYFYYQTVQADRQFQKHSQDHSEILAAVVELNIINALHAQDGLEDIVTDSLENRGSFIHYLDSVEPFSSSELTSFALESGLAGVKIITTDNGKAVSGPANWLPGKTCSDIADLEHIHDEQVYLYSYFPPEKSFAAKCVLVGLPAKKIEATLDEISVERLLTMFDDLHDIAYVLLLANDSPRMTPPSADVTETIIPLGDRQIIVALKNTRFGMRRAQMQKEFIIFISFLILCGGFSSWWLYRVQRRHLKQTREFERKMARQHEDAALGRAAATITHELRNPLNAIGMGLQRLQIETENLEQEHQELLSSMRHSVDRSNNIISRLKQYGDSFVASCHSVDLADILDEVATLYQVQCQEQHIEVKLDCQQDISIRGDKILLAQLFENLIKNSIEAQPKSGFLHISARRLDKSCRVEIANGGFDLSEEESRLLFEPYFTSKSQGTGLGLVISNKIIQAHKGEINWNIDFSRHIIDFKISLPLV